ncbi:outer membrane beta-barrel protein [Algivirga pacifica]|uniref:Outer membrane protein beta-barrel domain-containing protein n=1 Tax=Algivirga pacifica TaxID=1162670 RepID=A0ABP9D8T7_9BACT
MKVTYRLIFSLFILCLTKTTEAQTYSYDPMPKTDYTNFSLGLTYHIGIPTFKLDEFVSKTSWRGWDFDLEYRFNPQVSVSGNFGWQNFFEQKDRATYNFEGGAITGVRVTETHVWPLTVGANYYFTDTFRARPYAAFNVGAYASQTSIEIGLLGESSSDWSFGFNPEFGIVYPITPNVMELVVRLKYHRFFMEDVDILPNRSAYWDLGIGINILD